MVWIAEVTQTREFEGLHEAEKWLDEAQYLADLEGIHLLTSLEDRPDNREHENGPSGLQQPIDSAR